MMIAALQRRYAAPRYAFFEQVANATGLAGDGYADAMAMGLWPSQGLELFGFEVKVSRSDWFRELKKPEKAERFARHCHRWYIVAPVGVVTDIGEVPPAWGLLELKAGHLYTLREAQLRADPDLDWPLLAAILRRASETMVAKSALQPLAEAIAANRIAASEASLALCRKKVEELQRTIKIFEDASGVSISDWNGNRIGAAVRRVLDGDEGPKQQLRQIHFKAKLLYEATKEYAT